MALILQFHHESGRHSAYCCPGLIHTPFISLEPYSQSGHELYVSMQAGVSTPYSLDIYTIIIMDIHSGVILMDNNILFRFHMNKEVLVLLIRSVIYDLKPRADFTSFLAGNREEDASWISFNDVIVYSFYKTQCGIVIASRGSSHTSILKRSPSPSPSPVPSCSASAFGPYIVWHLTILSGRRAPWPQILD